MICRWAFHLVLAVALSCMLGCQKTASSDVETRPAKSEGASRASTPTTASAADDPDAGRPAWVKAYRLERKVIVTDEAGHPLAGAAVHVQSLNIDYAVELTGEDGSVILQQQLYIDPPRWVDVRHDGYESGYVNYPQHWPLEVKLRRGQS